MIVIHGHSGLEWTFHVISYECPEHLQKNSTAISLPNIICVSSNSREPRGRQLRGWLAVRSGPKISRPVGVLVGVYIRMKIPNKRLRKGVYDKTLVNSVAKIQNMHHSKETWQTCQTWSLNLFSLIYIDRMFLIFIDIDCIQYAYIDVHCYLKIHSLGLL